MSKRGTLSLTLLLDDDNLVTDEKEEESFVPASRQEIQASYELLSEKLRAYEYLNKTDYLHQQDRIQKLIAALDKKDHKFLRADEFLALSKQLHVFLSLEEAQQLVVCLDKDGNNAIDVDEFYEWWKAPIEPWSDNFSKVDWLRLKLRLSLLPREPLRSIKQMPSQAKISGWTKLKGAMRVVRFYKTLWRPVPDSKEEQAQIKAQAEEDGKVIKHIMFIRHGQSTSNAAWDVGHAEPWIFDARLTDLGIQQAQERNKELRAANDFEPQLIVSSPLTRAMMTCTVVWDHMRDKKVPFVINPLCREQVGGADDIGRMKAEIQQEFPHFDWSLCPAEFWWYIPQEHRVPGQSLEVHMQEYKKVHWLEPGREMNNRIHQIEKWLVERPENRIAVVAHGCFIERMCGIPRIGNCQQLFLEVNPQHPLDILDSDE